MKYTDQPVGPEFPGSSCPRYLQFQDIARPGPDSGTQCSGLDDPDHPGHSTEPLSSCAGPANVQCSEFTVLRPPVLSDNQINIRAKWGQLVQVGQVDHRSLGPPGLVLGFAVILLQERQGNFVILGLTTLWKQHGKNL